MYICCMENKICSICKKELLANSEFFASRFDRKQPTLQGVCRECQRGYRKKHYNNNKQKYIDKAAVWRKNERTKFIDFLKDKSCVDCGESDSVVLEFDHKSGKKFDISNKIGVVLLEVLLKEIEKCDIVCANCHKRRTAKQFNWSKASDA